jgi:DNA-binding transcriptional ArsR family regulator
MPSQNGIQGLLTNGDGNRNGVVDLKGNAAHGNGNGTRSSGDSIPVNWERLARATAHPLRVSILEILGIDGGRVLSPSDLSHELQIPLSNTNYHVTELAKAGLIVLVRQRAVRGATEHFLRLYLRVRLKARRRPNPPPRLPEFPRRAGARGCGRCWLAPEVRDARPSRREGRLVHGPGWLWPWPRRPGYERCGGSVSGAQGS